MDETQHLSWRARLAKANINILAVDPSYWLIEFTYHPKPGTFKWCKTYIEVESWMHSSEAIAKRIEDLVLKLRKELEG